MALDIFKNNPRKVPMGDSQIVRVDMEQIDIGGRKSMLPAQSKSEKMTIQHVPNGSSMPGNK